MLPNQNLPKAPTMMDMPQSSNPTSNTNIQVKLEIKTEPIDNATIKNEPGIKNEPIDLLSIKKEPKLEPGTIKQEMDVKPPMTPSNR